MELRIIFLLRLKKVNFTIIGKKEMLKTTRNEKKKNDKIVMLARSKLSNIESKISEALINSEISHEDFMTIINEEKIYRWLKESIRTMNSQRTDTKKINLIEESKKIDIDEVIKNGEIINKSLKSQILNNVILFKVYKNTESINPRVS